MYYGIDTVVGPTGTVLHAVAHQLALHFRKQNAYTVQYGHSLVALRFDNTHTEAREQEHRQG